MEVGDDEGAIPAICGRLRQNSIRPREAIAMSQRLLRLLVLRSADPDGGRGHEMSWSDFHKQSEVLAADAHEASRLGNADRAKELFSAAAEFEQRALQYVASDKPRTLGITAVSAVSLWYKAG